MKCPKCGNRMLNFDSRYIEEKSGQMRKYYCFDCKQGYQTFEECLLCNKTYVKKTKYIMSKNSKEKRMGTEYS